MIGTPSATACVSDWLGGAVMLRHDDNRKSAPHTDNAMAPLQHLGVIGLALFCRPASPWDDV